MLKVVISRTLLKPVVQNFITAGQRTQPEKGTSVFDQSDFTVKMVQEMLTCIPFDEAGNVLLKDREGQERSGYGAWRDLIFSASRMSGPDPAYEAVQNHPDPRWHDDEEGSRVYVIAHYADGTIGPDTLLYFAEINGYQLPDHLKEKRYSMNRTEGEVFLEDVLGGGHNYRTIDGKLRCYDGQGLYPEVDIPRFESTALAYFRKYSTGKSGQKKFAKTKAAEEAVKYVTKLRVPPEETVIDPPGINYTNGYRRVKCYVEGVPEFELAPHSPDVIFTWRSASAFNPNANPEELNKALLDIFGDPKLVEIHLRTVAAAAFGIGHVRENLKAIRLVKALILEGEGSNGKDTLREWHELFVGQRGMSSCSLSVFKDPDTEKREILFARGPLIRSLLNWASENGKTILDNLESLKNFLSGDPMDAAHLYIDKIRFKPKAVCIFNVNRLPALHGAIRAVQDRICIIRLQNVFVPPDVFDPENPRHREIDPRVKENKSFICESILSAYGNRLEQAYIDLCREGKIDYSPADKYFNEARDESCHLRRFTADQTVVFCDLDDPEALYSSELFELYQSWTEGEGYVDNSHWGGPRYCHPHEHADKIVTHRNQMLPRLRDTFGRETIKERHTNKGTKLGLKIVGEPKWPLKGTQGSTNNVIRSVE